MIPIAYRNLIDAKNALFQVLSRFRETKFVVSDNENASQANSIRDLLKNHFDAEQFFIPPLHSKSNGQVERFHSTLTEIARCARAQHDIVDTVDLIFIATLKYNQTVHSIVEARPIDIINSFSKENLDSIKARLKTETKETF